MKIARIFSFAMLVCAAAAFTTACSWFQNDDESELSPYWTPDDGSSSAAKKKAADDAAAKAAEAAKAAKKGAGAGDADQLNLKAASGSEQDGFGLEQDGPGEYGDDIAGADDGESYTEGFGARIKGVSFEPVYFLFDQNIILATQQSKIQAVADYLKDHPEAGVVIEGNCDERGTTEYNRALGEKRAIAAKTFLLDQGIEESRIKTISYGKERPASKGSDESAFKLNRRDDFVPVYLLKK